MDNSMFTKWLIFQFFLKSQGPPAIFERLEKGWFEEPAERIQEMIKRTWGPGTFVALEFSREPVRGMPPEYRYDVLSVHFFYHHHPSKHYLFTPNELDLHKNANLRLSSREGYAEACFQIGRKKLGAEIHAPVPNPPGRPRMGVYDEADLIRASEPKITKKAAFVKAYKKCNSESAWENMSEGDKESAIARYIDARRNRKIRSS